VQEFSCFTFEAGSLIPRCFTAFQKMCFLRDLILLRSAIFPGFTSPLLSGRDEIGICVDSHLERSDVSPSILCAPTTITPVVVIVSCVNYYRLPSVASRQRLSFAGSSIPFSCAKCRKSDRPHSFFFGPLNLALPCEQCPPAFVTRTPFFFISSSLLSLLAPTIHPPQ